MSRAWRDPPDLASCRHARLKKPRTRRRRHEAPEQTARPSADLTGVLFTTQSPVLSVEATGPRKVLIGKEAQFVVKIRNTGAAANNVVVTVNIPDYVEVISAQATAGTVPTRTGGRTTSEPLEWKINRLEAKSGETLNLKLVPRKSTPLDLAVHWTFTPEASQTLVEVQEPKLVMTISGPEEVMYGQSKIYKLTRVESRQRRLRKTSSSACCRSAAPPKASPATASARCAPAKARRSTSS